MAGFWDHCACCHDSFFTGAMRQDPAPFNYRVYAKFSLGLAVDADVVSGANTLSVAADPVNSRVVFNDRVYDYDMVLVRSLSSINVADVDVGNDGYGYAIQTSPSLAVAKVDLVAGTVVTTWALPAGSTAYSLAVDSANDAWTITLEGASYALRKNATAIGTGFARRYDPIRVSASGVVYGLFYDATSKIYSLDSAETLVYTHGDIINDFAIDSSGAIYLACRDAPDGGSVVRISSAGAVIWQTDIADYEQHAIGVSLDGSRVYVAGFDVGAAATYHNSYVRIDGATGAIEKSTTLVAAAGANAPQDLCHAEGRAGAFG